MKPRNSIIFLLAAVAVFVFPKMTQAETSEKVRLELKVLSSDHIIFIPAELEFRLTNLTENTIRDIENINYIPVGFGIKIYVIYNGEEKHIRFPVYPTSVKYKSTKFSLAPGESAVYRQPLLINWDDRDNLLIFTKPGAYTVYGTHPVPGYGLIESNRVEIEYRGPITKNEIEAVNLLKPFGNYLQYIYNPLQLFSVRDVNLIHNFVETIRKTYELEPETPYKKKLKNALLRWQDIEKKVHTDPNYFGLKKIGLDELNLQDLKLKN